MYPYKNIFFGGDTLSWTTNWIQGALITADQLS